MVLEFLQQEHLEVLRVVHGQLGHGVKGALRLGGDNAGNLPQLAVADVAAVLILLPGGVEVGRLHAVEGHRADLVQGGHAQTGLGDLRRRVDQCLVAAEQRADSGAAGAEALGYGVDENELLRHILKTGRRGQVAAVVDELAVDLVADEIEVMLLGDIRQQAQLLLRQDGAGGVARVGDQKRPGVFVDERLDLLPGGVAVAVLGPGMDRADTASRRTDKGMVIGIEGLGDNDLTALVEDTKHGHEKRLTAAGGNEDVAAVKIHPQTGVVTPHRLNEGRDAGGRRVGQDAFAVARDGVEIDLRGLNVRLADIQGVDGDAALSRRLRKGVELADGRQLTGVDLFG